MIGRVVNFACLVVASCFVAPSTAARADVNATASLASGAATAFQVVNVFHIGGPGRWDYCLVDPPTHRLFVSRETHTQVIDVTTGAVVGDIPNTAGVHGIALAPGLNRGFISDGRAGTITIFDLKTLAVLGVDKAGENPDCILFDPASGKVFAFNGRSHDATAVSAAGAAGDAGGDASGGVGAGDGAGGAGNVATIPLPGKPEFAVADGAGHVYVNIEDKSQIAVIDSKALKVTDVWTIDGGQEPSGLAIDVVNHRLYAGCAGNDVMAVIDLDNSKTLATAPIGHGVDACAFDPGTNLAFASCGDGTLTAVRETAPGTFRAVASIPTMRGARTMALDPTTHLMYLPTADFEQGLDENHRPKMKPDTFKIVVVVAPAEDSGK
jgi:DNA-binding beta-propeller fold protein YncE